jgi:hypothetical protein
VPADSLARHCLEHRVLRKEGLEFLVERVDAGAARAAGAESGQRGACSRAATARRCVRRGLCAENSRGPVGGSAEAGQEAGSASLPTHRYVTLGSDRHKKSPGARTSVTPPASTEAARAGAE